MGISLPRRLLRNFVSTRSFLPEGSGVLVGVNRGVGVRVIVGVGAAVVGRGIVAVTLAGASGVSERMGAKVAVRVGVDVGNKTEQLLINSVEEKAREAKKDRAKTGAVIALIIQLLGEFFIAEK